VRDIARADHNRPGGGGYLLIADRDLELPLEDVGDLGLVAMNVQGRPVAGGNFLLEDGIRAVCSLSTLKVL